MNSPPQTEGTILAEYVRRIDDASERYGLGLPHTMALTVVIGLVTGGNVLMIADDRESDGDGTISTDNLRQISRVISSLIPLIIGVRCKKITITRNTIPENLVSNMLVDLQVKQQTRSRMGTLMGPYQSPSERLDKPQKSGLSGAYMSLPSRGLRDREIGTPMSEPLSSSGVMSEMKTTTLANVVVLEGIDKASLKVQEALLDLLSTRRVLIKGAEYALPEQFMVVGLCEGGLSETTLGTIDVLSVPPGVSKVFRPQYACGRCRGIQALTPDLRERFSICHPLPDDLPMNIPPIPLHFPAAFSSTDISHIRDNEIRDVFVSNDLELYMRDIVMHLRTHASVSSGPGPRSPIDIRNVAAGLALIEGRSFVVPNDVTRVAGDVLSHRVDVNPITGIDGRDIVLEALQKLVVPV